ncbi:pilin [Candidatus Saccharibacteria bacterium]|nr:pilin [Candidatus Saccharibacteria bacterium]
MIQKIKNKILILSSLLFLAVPVAVPAVASAQDVIQGGLCKGAQQLTVQEGTATCTDTTAGHGVIAVIMIIVGGFRYITSGGNPESTKSARNTILYAIIGLVVVALAQIIVRFVLSSSTNLG